MPEADEHIMKFGTLCHTVVRLERHCKHGGAKRKFTVNT